MAALDKNGERVSLVTMTPKGYQETERKAPLFKKVYEFTSFETDMVIKRRP